MGKPRHDYQDERLARPMDTLDTDSILDVPQTFTEEFASYACECEGISGMKYIDTEFDNFVEDCIQSPRSDMGERPYSPGVADNPHNERFGATTPPAHAGVDNPAPVDTKKYLYPHRRY